MYLPSLPLANILVDGFFSECNWLQNLLEESHFRHSFLNFYYDLSSPNLPFLALFYAVLATGYQFAQPRIRNQLDVDCSDYGNCVYYLVKEVLFVCEDEGQFPLERLQAILTLSIFNQNEGKPKRNWNTISTAVQMARSMGLNREPQSSDSSISYIVQMKKRVWWGLYISDRMASLMYRGPPLTTDAFNDVLLPLNLPSAMFEGDSVSKEDEVDINTTPTAISAHIASIPLYNLAGRIAENCLSLIPPAMEYLKIYDLELDRLEHDLPQYMLSSPVTTTPYDGGLPFLKRQRAIVQMAFLSVRMTLHICYILRNRDSRKIAAKCAERLIDFVRQLVHHSSLNLGKWFIVAFQVFDPSALLVKLSHQPNIGKDERRRYLDLARQGAEILRTLSQENRVAANGIKVLDRLLSIELDNSHFADGDGRIRYDVPFSSLSDASLTVDDYSWLFSDANYLLQGDTVNCEYE